ncbi:MAG: redoxin domain-containing protein [Alphaproteobacteria bacterium]|nr:redoxin domain-containing protein [Alphaproteobacteria bacterium]
MPVKAKTKPRAVKNKKPAKSSKITAPMKGPKTGGRAPAFSMPVTGGGKVTLNDLLGKPFVLYFYPKDNTSGCTKEACDFGSALPQFKKLGIKVIGVSKDSIASHEKFKKLYRLSFELGSDQESGVAEKYGTWIKKSMYGRSYMGMERATFLIDSKGIVRGAWRKVKVPGHVDDVLAAVKQL